MASMTAAFMANMLGLIFMGLLFLYLARRQSQDARMVLCMECGDCHLLLPPTIIRCSCGRPILVI